VAGRIEAGCARCEVVVFLVSPVWAASKWCLAEFLFAKNLNKRIFAVIIEPTPFSELPTENDGRMADHRSHDGHAGLSCNCDTAGRQDDGGRIGYRGARQAALSGCVRPASTPSTLTGLLQMIGPLRLSRTLAPRSR